MNKSSQDNLTTLRSNSGVFLALDIGGTKIAGGIVTADGGLLYRATVPTEAAQGSDRIIVNASKLARELLQSHQEVSQIPVVALGVGSVGQIDFASGRIVLATSALPGWAGTCLKSALGAELGLPTFVENDANAAAYGEYRAGAARGYRHVVCLTLGTGIGGGVITDGELLRGATGGAAELGHVAVELGGELCPCGRRGCLEAYSSGSALLRYAKTRLESLPAGTASVLAGHPSLTGAVIFDAAASGDNLARDIVERFCRYLANGLVSFQFAFDPECFVLGGGVSSVGESLLEGIRCALPEQDRHIRLLLASLGNDAGLIGAALLARDSLERSATSGVIRLVE
jgi:glucokinase